MTRTIFLFFILLIGLNVKAQSWTEAQLAQANTAKNISVLNEEEKNTIKYLNLARLFPADFARIEIEKYQLPPNYNSSPSFAYYRKTLLEDLYTRKPVKALMFDMTMYEYALCWAKESGELGIVGHNRVKCKDGNFAECASYGMFAGRDIVIQWLIDDNVPSLLHRINSLNGSYTKVGVSIKPHKTYKVCAVADFIF